VGSLLAAGAMFLVGNMIFAIAVSLFLVCSFIIFFKWDGALKIACITVIIVCITTHGFGITTILMTALMRFVELAAGASISILATVLLNKIKRKE
jgi:uncharacterized membrane protein YgaE (UPF0421/DUF939 family)